MPAIPAQCTNPKCRAIYPSGIWVENSRRVSLKGNRSQCPVCGEVGIVAEGVFDVTTDTIQVLSAPTTTLDMLRRLQDILSKSKEGQLSYEDAEAAAAEISPELAALVRATKGRPDYLNYVIGLISIAIALWGVHSGNEFQAQLIEQQGQMVTSLNEIAESVAGPIKSNGEEKAEYKAKDKTIAPRVIKKAPNTRRSSVNAERRANLKARREVFGGSSLRHKYQHRR